MNWKRRRVILLSFLIILVLAFSPISLAKERFFELEKIESGMKGKGYSVFSGTKIESFDVQVLAVVEGDVSRDKLILVKLSGELLEESGGLAAGMSGSPVYIKDRLVGAISYGFENADSFLALVTPVESMLKLLPPVEKTVFYHGKPLIIGEGRLRPVVSPVLVSGMGRRGFNTLKAALEPYHFKPVFLFGSKRGKENSGFVTLKPGSAVAVQMVSGDYQVSAIGTVTLVEGDNFLAFGHSFTNKGKVDYLAYQAEILHTIKSQVMSFKIGLPLQITGRIIEDRQHGLLGRFRELPSMIPVIVTVKDLDRDLTRTSSFQVIDNEYLYKDLVVSGVTDAIDQTIDRVGSGTALVKLQVEHENGNSPITRENLFYGKDIAVSCLQDLRYLLDLLTTNEFSRVPVKSIQVTIDIQEKQSSARIIKLETDHPKAKPGDKVKLRAIIRTFRGQTLPVPFEIKLPANMAPGKLTLTVRGSSNFVLESEAGDRKKTETKSGLKKAGSLDELFKDFINDTKNNQVVLEYQVNESSGEDKKVLKEIQLKSDTLYCIYDEARFDLEIE
ncbi:MAG: SpoIVB peptidase S55 domain-containing protein [Bacteroidota bacterium]